MPPLDASKRGDYGDAQKQPLHDDAVPEGPPSGGTRWRGFSTVAFGQWGKSPSRQGTVRYEKPVRRAHPMRYNFDWFPLKFSVQNPT